MCETMKIMPAVPLRGMVILPGMIVHFDVSKPHSIHAVEEAMRGDEQIFLLTLKNPNPFFTPQCSLAFIVSCYINTSIWCMGTTTQMNILEPHSH